MAKQNRVSGRGGNGKKNASRVSKAMAKGRNGKQISRRSPRAVGGGIPGIMGAGGMPGIGMPGQSQPDISGTLTMMDDQIRRLEEQKQRVVRQLEDSINRLKQQREEMSRRFVTGQTF